MTLSNQVWLWLAAMALSAVSAVDCLADAKPNPYETIVDRNPFGLKPPPPPPDPAANLPPAAPPATVELTGITSIFQKHKALLEITPGPGKPVIRPILMEGERVDTIEVVSINVAKSEVTIKNGTLLTNLSLKVNKPAGGATAGGPSPQQAFVPPPNPFATPFNPANAGVPGAAAAPTVFTPGNAGGGAVGGNSGRGNVVVFGANNTPAAGTASQSINTFGAQPTTPAYNSGANSSVTRPGASFGAGGATTISPGTASDPFGSRTIPSRTVRAQQQQPQAAQGEVDPAKQYLNMLLQKTQADRQNQPFPPLPPIPGLDVNE